MFRQESVEVTEKGTQSNQEAIMKRRCPRDIPDILWEPVLTCFII